MGDNNFLEKLKFIEKEAQGAALAINRTIDGLNLLIHEVANQNSEDKKEAAALEKAKAMHAAGLSLDDVVIAQSVFKIENGEVVKDNDIPF